MAGGINKKDSDRFTVIETINGEKFDPRKHTLREFAQEYAKTLGKEQGATYLRNFVNTTSKVGKQFAEYADAPLIYLLSESIEDEANPLIKAYQQTDSVNSRRSIYSQVKGLESNIVQALDRLGVTQKEFPDGVPALTSRVSLPDKPAAKGARYQYDPGSVGRLQAALAEYAKNNPKDAPIVRALEMQMLTGLRPGEVANMPLTALKPPSEMSSSYGIYLSTDTPGVKMDAPLNIPAGPRQLYLINSAIKFKRSLGENGAKNDAMFVKENGSKVTTQDMTNVLKKIKVPGIMFDTETGKDINALQEAYDLRRLHATLSFNLYNDYGPGAAMRGRAIKTNTGSEADYVSPRPGFYTTTMLEPHVRVNNFFNNAYMKAVAKTTNNPAESLLGIPVQDAQQLAEEAKKTTSPIAYPGKRVAFNIDLASGTSSITFEDAASSIGMQAESAEDIVVNVKPPKLKPQDAQALTIDLASAIEEEAAVSPVNAESMKSKLQAYLDRLRKFKPGPATKGILTGLGVYGIATEAEAAASEEFGRSGSPLRAAGAGALRGTYELAETPLMMGLRAQPAGGPESSPITPEQQVAEGKTLEEQMGRIRQFEAKMGPGIGGPVPPQQRGLVDDEMSKLLQGE
jgi:hypothetical protein